MAKLPRNVQNLMREGHNVWVATTGEDGTPNIANKGGGRPEIWLSVQKVFSTLLN